MFVCHVSGKMLIFVCGSFRVTSIITGLSSGYRILLPVLTLLRTPVNVAANPCLVLYEQVLWFVLIVVLDVRLLLLLQVQTEWYARWSLP